MAKPSPECLLVDATGRLIDMDALISRLRRESQRVLADDEIGLVLYVGDQGLFSLEPTDDGEFLASPVVEVSRPRFPTRLLRRQIGAKVVSVTADTVFIVRDGETLKKIRAEKLVPGMVLASGEKVFR